MAVTRVRAHLGDALAWSPEAKFDRRRLIVSIVAMAVPMLAGLALGRPKLGYLLGLGAMLLASETPGEGEAHGARAAILPAVAAVAATLLIAPFAWRDATMVALVTAAATLVNYSRPAAIAGMRFIVLLVLNLGLTGGAHGGGAALLFGIGALWRLAVRLVAARRPTASPAPAPAEPERTPTPAQRRIHWQRMLKTRAGWQFALRLGGGLALACAIRDAWPSHHFGWIVLSIVLLTPRELEHLPVKITQRAIGTVLGVALTGALLHFVPSHVVLALIACLCGIAAPLLRPGNYAAYCVVATPVILLAMDAGGTVDAAMLDDRLIATLAASAIVVAANLAVDLWLRAAPGRKGTGPAD